MFFIGAQPTAASPFTFVKDRYNAIGGINTTIKTNTITAASVAITGTHQVEVQLISEGEIESVTIQGDVPTTLTANAAPVVLFAAYNFSAPQNSTLTAVFQTLVGDFGTAELKFTIAAADATTGTAIIDTRMQGQENMEFGMRYAMDPIGDLVDFASSLGGVTVSETRMTGLMWSSTWGWIDLQPPHGGISIDVISEDRAELDGFAWNEWIGPIYFGKVDGTGGVYIDKDGYFHGTAATQGFGYFSFGDYMALNPNDQLHKVLLAPANKSNSWARTSFVFAGTAVPTITLVSPADDPGFLTSITRDPTFTFHIEDSNDDNVGYVITIDRKLANGTWSPYRNFQQNVLAPPNAAGDNNDNFTYNFTTPFIPGDFRWRMSAFDELGAWSEYTEYRSFTIANAAPTVTLIYPADDDDVVGTRQPEFKFRIDETDGDKIRYVVEISKFSDFHEILAQSSPLSGFLDAVPTADILYTPPFNLPYYVDQGGSLYWRVRAVDIFGKIPDPLAYNHFTIHNATPGISNFSLQDNSGGVIPDSMATNDLDPTVVWTSTDADTGVTDTLTTHIEVYNSANDLLQNATRVHRPGTQKFTIDSLDSGFDYYVTIFICDEDLECSPSQTIDFSTEERNRFGNVGTATIAGMFTEAPNNFDRMIGNDADSSNNRFVWDPTDGMIDLNPVGGGVIVENSRVIGFAWNETLGWIRMNCQAPKAATGIVDTENNEIPDACNPDNYGVINTPNDTKTLSVLSGKARIEMTGDYIYFDEASYLADHPAKVSDATTSQIGVQISCLDSPEINDGVNGYVPQGHFSGMAWSDASGWIYLGKDELQSAGMAQTDAENYFPMTEWSCSGDVDPDKMMANQYVVFDARVTDYSYPIAQRSSESYAGDLCTGNIVNTDTEINVDKLTINTDGSVSAEPLDLGIDFSIGCKDPSVVGDTPDGKLWLTIMNNPSYQVTMTPGLYRVWGEVYDDQGNSTTFRRDESTPHQFENQDNPKDHDQDEFIFQVVAAKPVINTENSIQSSSNADSLIADGDDKLTLTIGLLDQWGNPVQREYKYLDDSDPKNLLKDVKMRAVFYDDVKLDQVNPGGTIGEAVDFGFNVNADVFEDSVHAVHYVKDAITDDDPYLIVDLKSIAPTSGNLSLKRIEAIVSQVYERTTRRYDVGQTDEGTNIDKIMKQNINYDIDFSPILIATVNNFDGFGLADSEMSMQPIVLTNKSDTVEVSDYDWLGLLRTQVAGGFTGLTTYRDVHLRKLDSGSMVQFGPSKNHYQERSSELHGVDFNPSRPSQFSHYIISKLASLLPTMKIHDAGMKKVGKDDSAHANTFSFSIAATPKRAEDQVLDEYPQLIQAIAIRFGSKVVRYPLATTTSRNSMKFITVSVGGAVHGEDYNPVVIIGTNAGTNEFSMVGTVYTRTEIRKIMYENYRSLKGDKKPSDLELVSSGGLQLAEFDNASDLLNRTAYMKTTDQTGWLRDGTVRWIERHGTGNEKLSVVLGDDNDAIGHQDFGIGPNQGPITLLVRGGNVYIRDNIITGDKSSLGIIVLRSDKNSQNGKEGNVFIDPSVSRIQATIYADGSIMSAADGLHEDGTYGITNGNIEEDEILDGFSSVEFTKQFSNQLLLRGSIVSQNNIGTSGDGELPGEEIWLPDDCESALQMAACVTDGRIKLAAKRYDLAFLRRYILKAVYDDIDDDGIKDSADCYNGSDLITGIAGCIYTTSETAFNPACEFSVGEIKPVGQMDQNICKTTLQTLEAPNNGKCVPGTQWCQGDAAEAPYSLNCTAIPSECPSSGPTYRKASAALIIEYDPKIKELTPVGMDLPAIVDFHPE